MLKPAKAAKAVKVTRADLDRRLAEVEQQFVELWGDMSSWWGVSRTMAEIHGLLFISGEALSAEDIQGRLGISRGNVSMNIRTLVEWGLVRRVRKRGDRRDYYESLADVMEMFTLLAAQRKRREIDPVLRTLHQCRDSLTPATLGAQSADPRAQQHFQRVEDMLNFLTMMERLAERFFTSHRGIQAAVELLVRPDPTDGRRQSALGDSG
jgi:DNA-binding transcriptional regulator GbsR (MarR family)